MKPTYLSLGCGPIHERDPDVNWINIDIEPSHKPDLCMDYLNIATEIKAESVSGILSVHSLEHLGYPEGPELFFFSCFKVMKPGAYLRVLVPDLRLAAEAYVSGRSLDFIHGPEFKSYYKFADSQAERFHFFMTAWEHRMVYDFALMSRFMTSAGFHKPHQHFFGESTDKYLCGRDRFQSESLICECRKPL